MLTKKQQYSINSLKQLKDLQPSQFCLIHVNKTKNNLHCVISTLFGQKKTLWSISGGRMSRSVSSNSRRKTRYTQRMVYNAVIEKIFGLGLNYLVLHCKGTISSKRFILNLFNQHFTVVLLKHCNSVAHNGTKPPAKRRL
uniref:Ribosomal protein S11 n=1 Tax=Ulva intestinalis TaxID=3116 RepID=A0A8K1HSW4_ULVIN|nr:ribosomal protein S11 [Ulva intestinalis]UBR43440.1 ribosomal protein S11 [Ulva intestinalis]